MLQSGYLIYLPTELLAHILSFLDGRSLARCSQVCRTIHKCIDNFLPFQYAMLLEYRCYVDGPLTPDEPTVRTRAERMIRHLSNWATLKWEKLEILVPVDESGRSGLWKLSDGILVLAARHSLQCIRLPSPLKGIEFKRWEHRFPAVTVHDISLDPSQDLVIINSFFLSEDALEMRDDDVVGRTIVSRFLSLESGSAHPLAQSPTLKSQSSSFRRGGRLESQISGDMYGILVLEISGTSSELLAYQWKSASLKSALRFQGYAKSFAFFSENIVALCFQSEPGCPPSVTLFKLGVPSGTSGYTVLANFLFPTVLGELESYFHISCLSPRASGSDLNATPHGLHPSYSPENQMVSILWRLCRMSPRRTSLITSRDLFVYVPLHRLLLLSRLDCANPGADRSSTNDDPILSIPWEEWGEKYAYVKDVPFVLQRGDGSHHQCEDEFRRGLFLGRGPSWGRFGSAAYGKRCVTADFKMGIVAVLDFVSPDKFAPVWVDYDDKGDLVRREYPWDEMFVSDECVLPMGEVFGLQEYSMRTRMRYSTRAKVWSDGVPNSGKSKLMIDAEHIVLSETSPTSSTMLTVLTM